MPHPIANALQVCRIGLALFLSCAGVGACLGLEPTATIATEHETLDLDISPSGDRLAVTTPEFWQIYDLENKKWILVRPTAGAMSRFTREDNTLLSFGTSSKPSYYYDFDNVGQGPVPFDLRVSPGPFAFNGRQFIRYIFDENLRAKQDRVEVAKWMEWDKPSTFALSKRLPRAVALSRDGKSFAVIGGQQGLEDVVTQVADCESGNVVRSFVQKRSDYAHLLGLDPHQCEFANDDKFLVLIGGAGNVGAGGESYLSTIVCLDIASGRERWNSRSKQVTSFKISVSADGRYVAVSVGAPSDGGGLVDSLGKPHRYGIRIFESVTGREVARLTGVENHVRRVVLSPNGKVVYAIAHRASKILVWDIGSLQHSF